VCLWCFVGMVERGVGCVTISVVRIVVVRLVVRRA
jgi:hypothetical protein